MGGRGTRGGRLSSVCRLHRPPRVLHPWLWGCVPHLAPFSSGRRLALHGGGRDRARARGRQRQVARVQPCQARRRKGHGRRRARRQSCRAARAAPLAGPPRPRPTLIGRAVVGVAVRSARGRSPAQHGAKRRRGAPGAGRVCATPATPPRQTARPRRQRVRGRAAQRAGGAARGRARRARVAFLRPRECAHGPFPEPLAAPRAAFEAPRSPARRAPVAAHRRRSERPLSRQKHARHLTHRIGLHRAAAALHVRLEASRRAPRA